jgi:Flp pilus assembly protein TadD
MSAFLSQDPEPEAHHLRGLVALEAQLLQDAVMEFREALRLNPNLPRVWNDLGVVMEALGNTRDALQCYSLALQCDPQSEEARENWADLTMQIEIARVLRKKEEWAGVAH